MEDQVRSDDRSYMYSDECQCRFCDQGGLRIKTLGSSEMYSKKLCCQLQALYNTVAEQHAHDVL